MKKRQKETIETGRNIGKSSLNVKSKYNSFIFLYPHLTHSGCEHNNERSNLLQFSEFVEFSMRKLMSFNL